MIAHPTTPTPPTADAPPVVTVKVTRNSRSAYGWFIESSHPYADSVAGVLDYIPKEHKAAAKACRANSLDFAIAHCKIPPAVWQDAIATEIAHRLSVRQEPMEATVISNPFTHSDAYLALGDGIYKLQPVALAPTCKALAVVKRKAMALAKASADRIVADGHRSVTGIIAEANKRFQEARIAQEAATHARTPPSWTTNANLAVRWTGTAWCVACTFTLKITSFIHRANYPNPAQPTAPQIIQKEWDAIPGPGYTVKFWTLLSDDGSYNVRQCTLDSAFPFLPHMKYDGSCLDPAMIPPAVSNLNQLKTLAKAIERCYAVVDLSSLLCTYIYWDVRIKAQTPVALQTLLSSPWSQYNQITIPCQRQHIINPDADDTFTVAPADPQEEL